MSKRKMPTLEEAIELLEQGRAVFKIKASDREAKRLVASILKTGMRPRRKRSG